MIAELRRRPGLDERRPGVFYRRSKAFLHFHEDAEGLFADLRTGADWSRFEVSTAPQRARLLAIVDAALADALPRGTRG